MSFLLDDGSLIEKDIFIKKIMEKYRDLGHIQQAINSRRRKFIKSKMIIEDADAKFLTG